MFPHHNDLLHVRLERTDETERDTVSEYFHEDPEILFRYILPRDPPGRDGKISNFDLVVLRLYPTQEFVQ